MIALGHTSIGVITGLGVATLTPGLPLWARILITFFIGVFSHYAFDWLPHGHYHMRFKNIGLGMFIAGMFDFFGAIILLLSLALISFGLGDNFWLITVGVLGAQAPDLWEVANQIGLIPQWQWVRAHKHFHHRILHWHSTPAAPHVRLARPLQRSDIWQVVVLTIALVLVI